jgi:leucine dehydrogenase
MEYLRKESEWVTGLRRRSGDPSVITAFGVYQGVKACARFRYRHESLEGRHVVVQGLGYVGYHLCKYLAEEGASLSVADIEDDRIRKVVSDFGATAMAADDVYGIDADIFSPCPPGAVINGQATGRYRRGFRQQPVGRKAARPSTSRERHRVRAGLPHQRRRLV